MAAGKEFMGSKGYFLRGKLALCLHADGSKLVGRETDDAEKRDFLEQYP